MKAKKTRIIRKTFFTINAESVRALAVAALNQNMTVPELARAAFGAEVQFAKLYTEGNGFLSHVAHGELWGASVEIDGAAFKVFDKARKANKIPERWSHEFFTDSLIAYNQSR